jgi:DNA-binding MurR/RpiR family transcriptional regulator
MVRAATSLLRAHSSAATALPALPAASAVRKATGAVPPTVAHWPVSTFTRAAESAESLQRVEPLLQRMGTEFPRLSKQLKAIARYVEQHHDSLALERIQDVAQRCEVQPSAVVRFAKHFGFNGFNELKRVFRADMAQALSQQRIHGAPSSTSAIYQQRVQDGLSQAGPCDTPRSSADITHAFIDAAADGLGALRRDLQPMVLNDAVALLAAANTLWVAGTRRAFPIASFLAYALQHTDKPVQLVSQVGGLHAGQLRGVREGDVMLAVSFAPYAEETLLAAQTARTRGAQVVALTDSRMSPLAAEVAVCLLVPESSTLGFRSLTNTLVTAQGLFVALVVALQSQGDCPQAAHP